MAPEREQIKGLEKELALAPFGTKRKKESECLPEKLEARKQYSFLKNGQLCFWLKSSIPLKKIEKDGKTSKPLASVVILDETHFMGPSERIYTAGTYFIKEVYGEKDDQESK